ncbi:hypothetical protein [Cryptosporangium sp. NPDC051539]|uniref:hypothetical protein n=1 Tax=Cryptosporangium sp. NPDC051539 TaxID=3363962 RepID=UPI0037BE0AB1
MTLFGTGVLTALVVTFVVLPVAIYAVHAVAPLFRGQKMWTAPRHVLGLSSALTAGYGALSLVTHGRPYGWGVLAGVGVIHLARSIRRQHRGAPSGPTLLR